MRALPGRPHTLPQAPFSQPRTPRPLLHPTTSEAAGAHSVVAAALAPALLRLLQPPVSLAGGCALLLGLAQ
jgi:hypothetical protein